MNSTNGANLWFDGIPTPHTGQLVEIFSSLQTELNWPGRAWVHSATIDFYPPAHPRSLTLASFRRTLLSPSGANARDAE